MPKMDSHQPYALEISVEPGDIDEMGHVNNVVYLKWVQAVATAHWIAAATPEEKKSLLWVVTKHTIEYKRPAYAQDTVEAHTWIGEVVGRAFERHTELLRKSDGKLLAKALTLWLPIDAVSRKPVAVSAAVMERFSHG